MNTHKQVNMNEQIYVCDIKDTLSTAAAASLENSVGLPLGQNICTYA
jgi:hypothetical protein